MSVVSPNSFSDIINKTSELIYESFFIKDQGILRYIKENKSEFRINFEVFNHSFYVKDKCICQILENHEIYSSAPYLFIYKEKNTFYERHSSEVNICQFRNKKAREIFEIIIKGFNCILLTVTPLREIITKSIKDFIIFKESPNQYIYSIFHNMLDMYVRDGLMIDFFLEEYQKIIRDFNHIFIWRKDSEFTKFQAPILPKIILLFDNNVIEIKTLEKDSYIVRLRAEIKNKKFSIFIPSNGKLLFEDELKSKKYILQYEKFIVTYF